MMLRVVVSVLPSASTGCMLVGNDDCFLPPSSELHFSWG